MQGEHSRLKGKTTESRKERETRERDWLGETSLSLSLSLRLSLNPALSRPSLSLILSFHAKVSAGGRRGREREMREMR
jgi:hypothetical protein